MGGDAIGFAGGGERARDSGGRNCAAGTGKCCCSVISAIRKLLESTLVGVSMLYRMLCGLYCYRLQLCM